MDKNSKRKIHQILNETKKMNSEELASYLKQLSQADQELSIEATAIFSLEKEGLISEKDAIEWYQPELNSKQEQTDRAFEEIGIGSQIGPYTLMSELGSGGMGTVYLAEQTQPVLRHVALKLLHMEDEEKAEMLASEIQALAVMNHSFIAKVFETGLSTKGQPWFAMEYVKGQPITQYCDFNQLSIRDRLKLFMKVCTGIQHAHMKGIIHRDIKPENILISAEEGEPTPKIIDFGVAKSIDSGSPQLRRLCQDDRIAGTPTYMSPEQLTKPNELDTRADVYALGLLLFELLVGVQPFVMGETSYFSVLHRIINESIPEPTIYFEKLGQEAHDVAKSRSTHFSVLLKVLKGDLKSIILKAMAKDRDDRYDSVSDLSMDIKRWLNGEEVTAYNGNFAYRCRKFFKRHWLASTAATVSGLSLIIGLSFSLYHFFQAVEAERAAALEAKKAWTINQFLSDMLASADPDLHGPEVKVVDILDIASADLDLELIQNQDVEMALRETLGETYAQLGLNEKAEMETARALTLAEQQQGKEHREYFKAASLHAMVLGRKGEYDQADELLSNLRARIADYPELSRRERIEAEIHHAMIKSGKGKYTEAHTLLNQVALELEERPEEDDTILLTVQNNLAQVMIKEKAYEEAANLLENVLDKRKQMYGEGHPRTLTSMNNLALLYAKMSKMDEARKMHEIVLEKRTDLLGSEHPQTLHAMDNLALDWLRSKKFDKAVELLLRSYQLRKKLLGENDSKTLKTQKNLVVALIGNQDYKQAAEISRVLSKKAEAVYGLTHRTTMFAYTSLGLSYFNQKQFTKALSVFEDISQRIQKKLPKDHPQITALNSLIGKTLLVSGDYRKAEPILIQTYEAYRDSKGATHPITLNSLQTIIALYQKWKKPDKLETYQALLSSKP
ncbi:MAG: hypothetical protein CR997_13830 [Acidobacteria bacterium]|nr:MAG: hypothetical protein CR997_13830 [Acidobacteriota bacterium]